MWIVNTRQKFGVSWIPDVNIVIYGYKTLILCIMEYRHKFIVTEGHIYPWYITDEHPWYMAKQKRCLSWSIPDINIMYHSITHSIFGKKLAEMDCRQSIHPLQRRSPMQLNIIICKHLADTMHMNNNYILLQSALKIVINLSIKNINK